MILNLDCRHGLAMLPDNSVDAILTDPPYELGFMGHAWDRSGIAYDVAMWREALRVLKPGGHMLAFSGSRTYHRMTCAIEDAGFEVRDSIMWVYGSGFPKSLDISKAIDKASATSTVWFGPWLKRWRDERGLSQKELCERCGFFGSVNRGGTIANWEIGAGAPTVEQFNKICEVLSLPFACIEEARRDVIGTKAVNSGIAFTSTGPTRIDITAPATLAAQLWEGWGTGLKPAHEPICVARKPMAAATVAANVMAWGVGGINIDGCRVPIDPNADASQLRTMNVSQHDGADGWGMNTTGPKQGARVLGEEGRWPANFMHDGSPEVLAMFPDAAGAKGSVRGTEDSPASSGQVGNFRERVASAEPRGDAGSAARFYQQCQWTQDDLEAALFFYCAKTNRKDRDEGCEHIERKATDFQRESSGLNQDRRGREGRAPATPARNSHPTVKPTDLMRYLCRLVTPPGGLIVDPFTGSGSTGKAAILEGFQFVGFELDPQYSAIANARLEAARNAAG